LQTLLNALQGLLLPERRTARVTTASAGYFLWLELPPNVDALEVHRFALAANISIAPGPMFSARREFRNCLRLNCGHPWSPVMDRAMDELAQIIRAVSNGRTAQR
jgi:DNA-binding transcriptional MocR family regulator